MDTVLSGIPKTFAYLDDIVVAGSTPEEHRILLQTVLERLQRYDIQLNRTKCSFFRDSIEYLGFVIDAAGIRPQQKKLDEVLRSYYPKNTAELQSLLGLINYYAPFVANLSTHLSPLYDILKGSFHWRPEHSVALDKVKGILGSDCFLTHYSATLPVRLYTDASSIGIGAVLTHSLPDGTEKPISYVSCRRKKT